MNNTTNAQTTGWQGIDYSEYARQLAEAAKAIRSAFQPSELGTKAYQAMQDRYNQTAEPTGFFSSYFNQRYGENVINPDTGQIEKRPPKSNAALFGKIANEFANAFNKFSVTLDNKGRATIRMNPALAVSEAQRAEDRALSRTGRNMWANPYWAGMRGRMGNDAAIERNAANTLFDTIQREQMAKLSNQSRQGQPDIFDVISNKVEEIRRAYNSPPSIRDMYASLQLQQQNIKPTPEAIKEFWNENSKLLNIGQGQGEAQKDVVTRWQPGQPVPEGYVAQTPVDRFTGNYDVQQWLKLSPYLQFEDLYNDMYRGLKEGDWSIFSEPREFAYKYLPYARELENLGGTIKDYWGKLFTPTLYPQQ